MLNKFGKVITAMVTAFDANGEVDIAENLRLGRHLIQTGTSTLLLTGTTGESPTLTHEEEFRLFEAFIAEFKGKVPIMVGTGSNSTKTAITATKRAAELGVDASLQVVPYYNKPSQEGIYQHFKAIATSCNIPILLYNIPGRTGTNMLPETIARLAEIPNIIGVKEAAGSVEQVAKIKAVVPEDFLIYSGDDGLTLSFMEKGACGVVSVCSHVAGTLINEMITLFDSGKKEEARAVEKMLAPLFDVMFITSNPTPVKYALRQQGFHVGIPRLPLVDVTPNEATQINAQLNALNLL